jgi:hypothetical protein
VPECRSLNPGPVGVDETGAGEEEPETEGERREVGEADLHWARRRRDRRTWAQRGTCEWVVG